jgi:branched-chain amino acid transport system substrate-binding protein
MVRAPSRWSQVVACALPLLVFQDPKRPEEEIVLGMSTALSGPTADLGNRMLEGVRAGFHEVGRAGGIHGRNLRLVALDDGYEPERAGPNVRRLVETENVLAIVGDFGTPTAVAALQITNATGTPYYGAFTGAGLLRKTPPDSCVVNYRASYAEETRAMVDALIGHGGLSVRDIGFLTQRDASGDAGFSGGVAALADHGLVDEREVLHVRYERNTVAVEKAYSEVVLAEREPRAMILVSSYGASAAFIRLARKHGSTMLFLNLSIVGSQSLLRELGDDGEGVIVTQVVPHFESDLPIVQEYRAALRELDPAKEPSFVSLEGYVSTRILCRALATIEGRPDRRSLVDALEGLGEFDIGLGEKLRLSKDEHQACHRVWPTILRGKRIVPFDWSELARGF